MPAATPEPGRLMMDASSIYPEYLSASNDFVCPGDTWYHEVDHPEDLSVRIDDHSYFYIGYAVTSDGEVQAFAEAHAQRMAEGLPFDEDLEVALGTGSGGGDFLIRLHKDNAQYLAERHESIDAEQWQARIPILIEHPGNHTPEGGNVLYMDGRVEFIPYPGKWPMTPTTMNLLRMLAER
jgi:prepilin-type processing-associated H-X9-DG protein